MTITMPEPIYSWYDDIDNTEHNLITTTQAEAYADARVRKALGEILTISLDARHISDIENKISEMLGGLK